jgi:hypothetical protein
VNPIGRMRYWQVGALLAACLIFRLLFGLSREFFFEDQTQVFLLGLRYYATGSWPYFGPDVVWTRTEIPGALQALLVGLPLRVVPAPESPFVLLNLVSFAALSAFAWYACAQVPRAPRWLVWGWFMTIPWTLQFSTQILNTSYILAPAIVFFIGFFEATPPFTLTRIPAVLAFGLMGLGVGALIQIHMSWPLLLPFAAYAWIAGRPGGAAALASSAAAFVVGGLIPASLLLPTLARYGLHAGSGGVTRNLDVHWVNPWVLVTTLGRFLSFASLEINRFVAEDGAKRLAFFGAHPWLAPLAIAVWLAGIVMPLWMLVSAFRPLPPGTDPVLKVKWRATCRAVAASVLLVYSCYWLVVEPPQAHAFYVLAPIAFIAAAFWWALVDSPRAQRIAAAVLALNVSFHAGLAWAQAPQWSLYRHRRVVAAAVRLKSPEMFAHRRDFAIGGGPPVLSDPSRPFDVARDLEIRAFDYHPGPAGSVEWTAIVRNGSAVVAYRDLLCIVTYLDEGQREVANGFRVVNDILEPGEERTVTFNDRFGGPAFSSARVEVRKAEALLPVPVD